MLPEVPTQTDEKEASVDDCIDIKFTSEGRQNNEETMPESDPEYGYVPIEFWKANLVKTGEDGQETNQ